jgi:hypothetical protein
MFRMDSSSGSVRMTIGNGRRARPCTEEIIMAKLQAYSASTATVNPSSSVPSSVPSSAAAKAASAIAALAPGAGGARAGGDDDDADGGVGPVARKPRRQRTRVERASDEGVWTAALFLAFVAFLMPLWFLGAGSALSSDAGASDGSRVAQIVLLGLGSVAVWFGARVSVILARAPRLGRGYHRNTMRRLSIVAALLAAVFLHRFIYNAAGLASDVFAYIGAVAPAVLMAEVSFALPAITKHRHGAEIGSVGGIAWAAVAGAVLVSGLVPSLWWLPTVIAVAASAWTGAAALRIWRRYEGRVIGAVA